MQLGGIITRSRSPSQPLVSPLPSPRPPLGVRKAASNECIPGLRSLSHAAALGKNSTNQHCDNPMLLSAVTPRRAVSADHALVDTEPKGRVVVIRERLEDPGVVGRGLTGTINPSTIGTTSTSSSSSSLLRNDGGGGRPNLQHHHHSLPPPVRSITPTNLNTRKVPTSSITPTPLAIIDPTETVDLPSYGPSFLPQASTNAMGASPSKFLGPAQSMGASALVGFVPPPLSPSTGGGGGRSSGEKEEEKWRRALLFEAVDLSISTGSGMQGDFERDREWHYWARGEGGRGGSVDDAGGGGNGGILTGMANTSGSMGTRTRTSEGSAPYGREYVQ